MEAHWTWQGTEVEGEKSMKGKTQEVKSSSKETPPTLGKKQWKCRGKEVISRKQCKHRDAGFACQAPEMAKDYS